MKTCIVALFCNDKFLSLLIQFLQNDINLQKIQQDSSSVHIAHETVKLLCRERRQTLFCSICGLKIFKRTRPQSSWLADIGDHAGRACLPHGHPQRWWTETADDSVGASAILTRTL